MSMPGFIDLTNQTFGDWIAIRYLGDSMWECINSKGEIKNIHSYTLRTRLSNHTKLGSKQPDGILGNTFGQWTPIKYIGGGFWECKCTCGNVGKVNTYDLKNGLSTKCKDCAKLGRMKTVFNTGDKIGEWTVMHYAGDMRWHCKCSCGKEKDVLTKYLKDGTSKSCGHDRNYHIVRDDITGRRFGSLVVLGYTGANNMWKCQCDCGNIKNIHRDSLMTGKTKSCGCLKETLRKQTLTNKYGENNTIRITRPREEWQIYVLHNKDGMKELLNTLGHKPTIMELRRILDVREGVIKNKIKEYGLVDDIQLGEYSGESSTEIEIAKFLESNGINVEKHDRTILSGRELDIYIPNSHIAIEVNGDYWHSSLFKSNTYHQQKTFECLKNGIQLIHIFEHEWNSRDTNSIFKNLILCNIVHGRFDSKNICRVDKSETLKFLQKYSNSIDYNIKICIGYKELGEIKGVITFTDSSNSEMVVSNIAWRCGLDIGKMLWYVSTLIREKNDSIVIKRVCNMGTEPILALHRAGFIEDLMSIEKPSRFWVDIRNSIKVSQGNNTDSDMMNLGYVEIYDSGKMTYRFA